MINSYTQRKHIQYIRKKPVWLDPGALEPGWACVDLWYRGHGTWWNSLSAVIACRGQWPACLACSVQRAIMRIIEDTSTRLHVYTSTRACVLRLAS